MHSGFDESPPGDSTEKDPHLTPRPVGLTPGNDGGYVGAIGGVPVYSSIDVPIGEWVNVPKGMSVIEGCYVDSHGILRFAKNNAPAVWHHSSACKNHQPPCSRRINDVSEITYDDNNAPWCPDCIGWAGEDRFINALKEMDVEE